MKSKVKSAEETLKTFMDAWHKGDWTAMNAVSTASNASEIQKEYERFVFKSYMIFNTEDTTDTSKTFFIRVALCIKASRHEINGRQMSIKLTKKQRKWYVIPASLFEQ